MSDSGAERVGIFYLVEQRGKYPKYLKYPKQKKHNT